VEERGEPEGSGPFVLTVGRKNGREKPMASEMKRKKQTGNKRHQARKQAWENLGPPKGRQSNRPESSGKVPDSRVPAILYDKRLQERGKTSTVSQEGGR